MANISVGIVQCLDDLIIESEHVLHTEYCSQPPFSVIKGIRLMNRIPMPPFGRTYRCLQDAAAHLLRDAVIPI